MLRRTHDDLFAYKDGIHRIPGRCRIRVYGRQGSLPLVIATELADNPGPSITNAVEALAEQVWRTLLPHAREGFLWVEHYSDASYVRPSALAHARAKHPP